jgi:signal transduction histidine kinase
LEAMDRMARLNKNLLLLSKIENRQFFETEDIELNAAVQKSVQLYQRQATEKKIHISFSLTECISIKANPVLFDVLVSNLISNAIRYAPESSSVVITCTPSEMVVSNTGFPLEFPEKIFERFHRESRTNMGNGLGLSIVKKICSVAGFAIDYRYRSSTHYFSISFLNTSLS